MDRRGIIQDLAEVRYEKRQDGAGNESQTISGYAAVFYRSNDPGTEYRLGPNIVERIMPGAFDRAIAEDDVTALFNHDPSLVLGRSSAGTLTLSTNRRGLRYEVEAPDTSYANDLIVSLNRGDVRGSSFGFAVEAEKWSREGNMEVREIHGVRLVDVSPVTNPAYVSTTAGVREEAHFAEFRDSLQRHESDGECESCQQLQSENDNLKARVVELEQQHYGKEVPAST